MQFSSWFGMLGKCEDGHRIKSYSNMTFFSGRTCYLIPDSVYIRSVTKFVTADLQTKLHK